VVSLRFPYRPMRISGTRPLSLPPATTQRWRPIVPVSVRSIQTGRGQHIQRAVADTGADDTIFPLYMATGLGVALLGDPNATSMILWGGNSYSIRYGEVELELNDKRTSCRWRAVVAFSNAPLNFALLGEVGVLQFFNATFRGADRVTELEPIPAFPGSVA